MDCSDDQIREAFSIAYFADYGHFLTHFAQAILHADEENFAIPRDTTESVRMTRFVTVE